VAVQSESLGSKGWFSRALSSGAVSVFMIMLALFWMTPTAGLLLMSLRSGADNAESGWWTVLTSPRQLTLQPYKDLLDDPDLVGALVNTANVTVAASVIVVFVAALAAYAFALMEFKYRDGIFLMIVALLVVPLQMALIPIARLFGQVGLFGTIPGAVIFHVAFGLPFAIFLLRNFFIGLPEELLEAARIDGASELQIFSRIVLPLGAPAIASLLIFQFLWTWNDLLVSLVFLPGESQTITVFIQQQLRQFSSNVDIIAPGAFLSMIVPLIVFFAFQRYFVQGLLAGSVK
jgi:alpha-glucoside transport system permease protein